MKRRLTAYREANESQIAEPSISEFFKNNEVAVFPKDSAESYETAWSTLKIFIEREGKPVNFVFGEESEEAKRRILVEMEEMHKKETERVRMLMEQGIEMELKKQKETHIKGNMLTIK